MQHVKQLVERFRKSLNDEPWEDQLAFAMVLMSVPLAYFFGIYWIVPGVLGDEHWILQCLGYGIPTWTFLGIFANLYMMDLRNASIRNRILTPPNSNELSGTTCKTNSGIDADKNMKSVEDVSVEGGFVLLDKPSTPKLNSNETNGLALACSSSNPEAAWHVCKFCEVSVPPRAWHCKLCKSCILRRDHHCIFIKKCIGQDNLPNFIGFLFYTALGTSCASLLSFLDHLKNEDTPIWWYFFRSALPPLGLPYDFCVQHLLTSIVVMGALKTVGNFFYCVSISARGETYLEWRRTYHRNPNASRTPMSYDNLRKFLGPNPIYRIIWPFHSKFQPDPTPNMEYEHEKED